MSVYLVKEYQAEVERIIQYGGSYNEGAISNAFHRLLNEYCKSKNLFLVPQLELKTRDGKIIKPDGTVKDTLRLDWGYWESKDKYDDLEKEIEYKISKGYPTTNILFEDSQKAILIQHGVKCKESAMNDAVGLDELLLKFIEFERPEVRDFREAIEKFKEDIPTVVDTLRQMIEHEEKSNKTFKASADKFLAICHDSINPFMIIADVREMMIQHILTEEIFLTVFNESQFHKENNVAIELDKVVDTFFIGKTKRDTLDKIDNYYKVIKRTASDIYNHQEKQRFLKVVYENFYKAYNIKAADRLGIIYTPNEVVRFMIEATDYLIHTHFGKFLYDKDVEILDPFTGTGTYITEIIDFLPKAKLEYKYKNEIHCNEVAILPYYIANLNIEYTYKQKMDKYEEFTNICFVDTLDNITFGYKDQQVPFDFGLGLENADRIKKQNEKKISVIISNPPYNANQLNENENNKNRPYPVIDKRIQDTYIHNSKAQKTKLYDMYARAFRWATDRLNKNGILAFITNSSFIDSRTFDGFRKVVCDEFNDIYIIDLGGNIRTNPKLSGTKHNVFGIQTGVAISFFIKKELEDKTPANVYYIRRSEDETAFDKLEFLSNISFKDLNFLHIQPDHHYNWINQTKNDFNTLLPIISKQTKLARKKEEENSIFKIFSLGVVTARDEWVYDFDLKSLKNKINYFIDTYNKDVSDHLNKSDKTDIKNFLNYKIKWTRAVIKDLTNSKYYKFEKNKILKGIYRPFTKQYLYFSKELNEMQYQLDLIFSNEDNRVITFSGTSSSKPFQTLATDCIFNHDLLEKTQSIPLYYIKNNKKVLNITDWGLDVFKEHYKKTKIIKEDIFYYVYAVLHNTEYISKYRINLTREFPRIPFYENFHKWVKWGKQLMELHLNYEKIKPYPLKRIETNDKANQEKLELLSKAKLKVDKQAGTIELDGFTTLKGIPKEAWEYKLGNRSALEWILDQYKEKNPKDPTIREKFNTYRFKDYKEEVIELIQRVTTVSIETVRIVKEISKE